MKRYTILFLFFYSCASDQSATTEILKTDIAMSDLATKIGFYKALIAYAEDSVIIPRPDRYPMMNKKEIENNWKEKPVITELTWQPIKAYASKLGDLGYTFGYSTYRGKDTVTYTNYCTIWHKQRDGSWKFVYDGGNSIPGPLK